MICAREAGLSPDSVKRIAPLRLFGRVSFLRLQPCLFRGACRFSRAPLLGDDQTAPHQLDKSLLCQVPVLRLAAGIAGDDANLALAADSRRQSIAESRALFLRERARSEYVPDDLDARRSLVDVLAAGAGRARDANFQLASRNRHRFVDCEKVLWCAGSGIAHAISASETA
jgi:hypothetical protein